MVPYRKRMPLLPYRIGYMATILIALALLKTLSIELPANPDEARRSIPEGRGNVASMRRLLYLTLVTSNDTVNRHDNVTGVPGSTDGVPGNGDADLCTVPAYHEFPPDLFSQYHRSRGAIIVHFLVVIYMFIGLALVCDVYFVASLEKICEKLHMSDDVAGATFMAAGSSAPELFTSIIGVFIAKGDVGVGTIIGSAVFNILFVIGVCGLMVAQATPLARFPLVRDITFYTLSVALLILSIMDSRVTWYESAILLLLYGVYIICMVFNSRIYQWTTQRIRFFGPTDESACSILHREDEKTYYQSYEMFDNEIEGIKTPPLEAPVIPVDEYIRKSNRQLSFEDACFHFMKSRRFSPVVRFRTAAFIIILERRRLMSQLHNIAPASMATDGYQANADTKNIDVIAEPDVADSLMRCPNLNDGIVNIVQWFVTVPISAALYVTIPDCRKKRWDKWYMVTFCLTIVWIALFSYIMVWMVALIGFTLRIPDSIMGITFLAAGTSVPDAMASVMVARQGHGDMAVSNTMGSNVFDILICLALPWFIMTTCVAPGSSVHINSNGMVFSVLLLFLTVVITFCAVHFGGWKLDKKLGCVCLISYALFLVFSCLIEFNIFGFVNLPMCTE